MIKPFHRLRAECPIPWLTAKGLTAFRTLPTKSFSDRVSRLPVHRFVGKSPVQSRDLSLRKNRGVRGAIQPDRFHHLSAGLRQNVKQACRQHKSAKSLGPRPETKPVLLGGEAQMAGEQGHQA